MLPPASSASWPAGEGASLERGAAGAGPGIDYVAGGGDRPEVRRIVDVEVLPDEAAGHIQRRHQRAPGGIERHRRARGPQREIGVPAAGLGAAAIAGDVPRTGVGGPGRAVGGRHATRIDHAGQHQGSPCGQAGRGVAEQQQRAAIGVVGRLDQRPDRQRSARGGDLPDRAGRDGNRAAQAAEHAVLPGAAAREVDAGGVQSPAHRQRYIAAAGQHDTPADHPPAVGGDDIEGADGRAGDIGCDMPRVAAGDHRDVAAAERADPREPGQQQAVAAIGGIGIGAEIDPPRRRLARAAALPPQPVADGIALVIGGCRWPARSARRR